MTLAGADVVDHDLLLPVARGDRKAAAVVPGQCRGLDARDGHDDHGWCRAVAATVIGGPDGRAHDPHHHDADVADDDAGGGDPSSSRYLGGEVLLRLTSSPYPSGPDDEGRGGGYGRKTLPTPPAGG